MTAYSLIDTNQHASPDALKGVINSVVDLTGVFSGKAHSEIKKIIQENAKTHFQVSL